MFFISIGVSFISDGIVSAVEALRFLSIHVVSVSNSACDRLLVSIC